MRASRLRWLIPAVLLVGVVLVPLIAWGQTPPPGEEPEVVRPWTWWLSIPIALGGLGLAMLIGLLYARLSSRFFAREEAPEIPARPRAYAGVNAPAYPAPAQPAPAPAAAEPQPTAPEAEAKPEPAPEPEPEEKPEGEPEPEQKPEPEAEQKPEPEAEQKPEPEAEQKPEPEAEQKPEEAESEEKPAEGAGEGEDVYERVLKEQLEKGVSPKVAEGRAKAAAHRARQSG